MLVDRGCRRLHDVNVGTTDIFDRRALLPVGISRQVAAVGFHAEMVRHRGSKPGIRTTADDTQNSGHQNLLARCIQTHHRPPPALGHQVAGLRVFGQTGCLDPTITQHFVQTEGSRTINIG